MNKKEILLSANNIKKSYFMGKSAELKVLKGIDLTIRHGEILAVVGASGAGKSTLLHIIGALDRPTVGQVFIQKNDIFKMSEQKLADFRNQRIGFVYQFHYLLPEFTAVENVAMPGLISRQNYKQAFHTAEKLLDEVGLSDRLNHKPRELSGGEQQRVAFARSLQNDPDLILADEPSGNLDVSNSQSLHELMWDFVRNKHKTFVVVTHNKELASNADNIVELYDGNIVKN